MKDPCGAPAGLPKPAQPGPRYWRDLWKRKKLARVAAPGLTSAEAYWSDRKNVADLYVKSRSRKDWQGTVDAQFRAMDIPYHARVLDIGAGTGTHAITLALAGCDVTAVEPSPAMREVLEKNFASSGIDAVTVIPSRWEDVLIDQLGNPYDIVLASYSLAMTDIGAAVEKMQACCRGSVHLFWFLTPPPWEQVSLDLWPRLHGCGYSTEPLANCLWQALNEMGIYAGITTERRKATTFRTIEEAVREYSRRLNCPAEEQQEILRDYFTRQLLHAEEGFVFGTPSYSAHIRWKIGPG